MIGYRIVEIKNGKPLSLFHGTNKSREIPLDTWHKASIKTVKDGRGNFIYISGWHFFISKQEAINFFNSKFRVKNNRKIIKCYVRGNVRPKHVNTNGTPCYLADEILIKTKDLINVS